MLLREEQALVGLLALLLATSGSLVEAKICQSIDVRNHPSNLLKLNQCTVIVGDLQICLFDHVTNSSEVDYVFPNLTEITGYMMIYRVNNLVSVGQLFPNLKVIRGTTLFGDYALILYRLPDLQEIGLYNLVNIGRGSVILSKCPLLCYFKTINWERIGTSVLYSSNNASCAPCPRTCSNSCWNGEQCQLEGTNNCHKECMGCTKDQSPFHCRVCKNFEDNGECVETCPYNKVYNVKSFKCVTKEECNTMLKGGWWVFRNQCVSSCPRYYEETANGKGCQRCKDFCRRVCQIYGHVDSLSQLQELQDCTIINGTLDLRISSVMEPELTLMLGSIRVITGALKVIRSKPITSLMFMENLTEIQGQELYHKQFALYVVENQNLEKLWDFENRTLRILNGSILFHDNPQLCVSVINEFSNITGVKMNNYFTVSNGLEAACNLIEMNVYTRNLNSTNVTLVWKDVTNDLTKNYSYIGYTTYYKEQLKGNASTFQSQDQCRGWDNVFSFKNEVNLTRLKPFTRYAYYIKIYTTNMNYGQSSIKYFTTLSDDPDKPRNLEAVALSESSIKLSWKAPKITNGILSHYHVSFYYEHDNPDIYLERDYCLYPPTKEGEKVDDDLESNMNHVLVYTQDTTPLTCAQKCRMKDELQVRIFNKDSGCSNTAIAKYGGKACKQLEYYTENLQGVYKTEKRNSVKKSHLYTRNTTVTYGDFDTKNPNITMEVVKNLKHAGLYIFLLSACNERHSSRLQCSGIIQVHARTKKRPGADDVLKFQVSIEDNNVTLMWSEPSEPNGVVLSYKMVIKRIDEEHHKPIIKCLTRRDYLDMKGKLVVSNLPVGEYLVSLQTVTTAGINQRTQGVGFAIQNPVNDIVWISIIVAVILLTIASFVFYYWFKRKRTNHNLKLIASINPDYARCLYVDEQWEIERNDLELHNELGKGSFGVVYSGLIKSRNMLCAVKTLHERMNVHDGIEFLNEALVMKCVSDTHHVVKLLGVVSRGHPPMVVMELMARGDLKTYLHLARESSQSMTSNEIYRMAIEIADGMAYLAAKKFVHRDLAARNCMVSHDRTVKIGDFGMTRDIYVTDYYRKETKGLLPVRWMAPESLADGVFSSQSDVWSYGIVLWEISTLAEQPYQAMANETVLQFVITKGTLQRPLECPDLLYEIMEACWSWKSRDRPTFGDIVERLVSHVGQDFKVVSYYLNRNGHEYMNMDRNAGAYTPFGGNQQEQSHHW